MNKPQNKKRCGNCGCYNRGRNQSNGENYSVCDADFRVDKSDLCCSEWIPKKYKRKKKIKMTSILFKVGQVDQNGNIYSKKCIDKLIENQKDIEPEYVDIVNKDFWDLV